MPTDQLLWLLVEAKQHSSSVALFCGLNHLLIHGADAIHLQNRWSTPTGDSSVGLKHRVDGFHRVVVRLTPWMQNDARPRAGELFAFEAGFPVWRGSQSGQRAITVAIVDQIPELLA